MSNKLYVGNLSFRVTSEDLQEYFGAAGAVESANVVYDRETGRSRGFGFVEMADEDAANAAISQFNGQEYDGRKYGRQRSPSRARNRGQAAVAAEAVEARRRWRRKRRWRRRLRWWRRWRLRRRRKSLVV